MKATRPKWFDTSPHDIRHRASTLQDVAKVLDYEAKLLRQQGIRNAARTLNGVANQIRLVAGGMTWAAAFDWPPSTVETK